MSLLVVLLSSFFLSLAQAETAPHSHWSGDDVYVRVVSGSDHQQNFSKNLSDCRKRIPSLLCWVDPVIDDDDSADADGRARPCLKDSEKFASAFEGHFDRSPKLIQEMYCHLDKIWIEKSFAGTAYASPLVDKSGRVIAGGIGVREEVLNSPLSFDDWLSWKEETTFGGDLSTNAPRLHIIQYKSNHPTKEFFVDYLLDHEFGHLFDFANKLNRTLPCSYEKDADGNWKQVGKCTPLPGSWGEISWTDNREVKPAAEFPFREGVCFYFCNGKFVAPANIDAMFSGLMKSTFQTTYASRFATEDWAEAFALVLAHEQLGLSFGAQIGTHFYDLSQHLYSVELEPKRLFVDRFLSGIIYYPGTQR